MKILALEFSSSQRSVAVLNFGAFSLTPALSRWERENGTQSQTDTSTHQLANNPAQPYPQTRDTILPLPQGEGRGEGEAHNPHASSQVSEVVETGRGNTMQPFAMIETALADANMQRGEIECIVVGLGPGSYTGIRAGIALAQGWQLARDVKLLGVSSVEAIVAQAQEDGLRGAVNVLVDAQRGEFYLAMWELSDGGHRETEPLRIVSLDEVKERANAGQSIVGPEVTRWIAPGKIIFPRAAMLAKLAMHRADFVGGAALEPIYLRATTFVKAPAPRVV